MLFVQNLENADRCSAETQNCLNPTMAVCFTSMAATAPPISWAFLQCDLATLPSRGGVLYLHPLESAWALWLL